MDVLIMLFTLVAFATCDSKALYVEEGETARLSLPYPCESTEVKLSYEYKAPFYSSADDEKLTPPSSNYVVTNLNETQTGNCSLLLTINHVEKRDEGTYFLTAYTNGHMLSNDTQIRLNAEPINVLPTSTVLWFDNLTTSRDPLHDIIISSDVSTALPIQATKGHPKVEGSNRSVISYVVICFFGLYILLLICLAVGMLIFRWEMIFHPPGRGLGMEGYEPPNSKASTTAPCREKNERLLTLA